MSKNLDLVGLQKLLLSLSGAQPLGFTAVHEPEMRARNNPFRGRVWKRSRGNGWVNFRYVSSVIKQRERENVPGLFVAAPRVWGHRVAGCPLVVHVTDSVHVYLEIKLEKCVREYFDKDTFAPIDAALIGPLLKKKRRPGRQGVQKVVELRDYDLNHIAELTIAKQSFRVAPLFWLAEILGR